MRKLTSSALRVPFSSGVRDEGKERAQISVIGFVERASVSVMDGVRVMKIVRISVFVWTNGVMRELALLVPRTSDQSIHYITYMCQ